MSKHVVIHGAWSGMDSGSGAPLIRAFRREDHANYTHATRDTQVNGAAETAVEQTNRKGTYLATAITDGAAGELTGYHLLQLWGQTAGDPQWHGDYWADMSGAGTEAAPIIAYSSLADAMVAERLLSVDANQRLERAAKSITTGTADAGSSTTSVVTATLSPAATKINQFRGLILAFAKDTTTVELRGQKTDITASTAGGVLTVTALTDAPVSGDTFSIE